MRANKDVATMVEIGGITCLLAKLTVSLGTIHRRAWQRKVSPTGAPMVEIAEERKGANFRARLAPKVVFESGQFSSLLGLVGAGMGVSVVPEMAVQRSARCRYLRIADAGAQQTIGAVVLRGRSLSRAHQAFLATLRSSAAPNGERT